MLQYFKKKLDNGITIILAPMKDTAVIAMGFFIRAGSRDENEDASGVAHFLEHMMFKGTSNRTAKDMFLELDTIGAEYNAVTSMEYTYYYLYGNSNDTRKILDITLDMYLNPILSSSEINKERKIILEEKRMRAESPYVFLHSILQKKLFKGSSLERAAIGSEESIKMITRKKIIEFREQHYLPSNTVFVITGNFHPKVIYPLIEKSLKNVQSPEENIKNDESLIFNRNYQEQIRPYIYIRRKKTNQQVYLIMSFPMKDLYQKKRVEIDLISQLLTIGSSSRLSVALREKNGITYSIASYPLTFSDTGVFVIQASLHTNSVSNALKIICKELRLLKTHGFSNEEKKKIIAGYHNEFLFSHTRPIDYLTLFGIEELQSSDDQNTMAYALERLPQIKSKDIIDVAQEIFLTEKINIFLYGQVNETEFDFLKI